MKKIIYAVIGLASGITNGLLGAGGGMILVPSLTKSGLTTKKAHANSVAIILPICIFSAILYISQGSVTVNDAFPYIIWGIIGSVIGSFLLTKINSIWLKRIFGVLMIWAAIRMWFR